MMKKAKRTAVVLFFCLLYLICAVYALKGAREIQRVYPGWSLRLNEEISHKDAEDIKNNIIDSSTELPFPTFWTEEKISMESYRKKITEKVVYYNGKAALALPTEFLSGAYPGELDTESVAVSNYLACELWGTEDAIGCTFKVDKKEYTVCGVFKSEEKTAIINGIEEKNLSWKNIEFLESSIDIPKEKLEKNIEQFGIAQDVHYIDGEGLSSIMRFAFYIPVLIGTVILFIYISRLLPKRSIFKGVVIFIICLILAAILPKLVATLPQWLLPTKWSDFTFWTGIFEGFEEEIKNWLRLVPQDKDLPAKFAMIRQMCLLFISSFAVFGIWKTISKNTGDINKPESEKSLII